MIGESMGEVEDMDADEGTVAWGEYLRIKVKLDVSKPLMRAKKANLEKLGTHWVRFSYDRMLKFCYACGMLGYGHSECIH